MEKINSWQTKKLGDVCETGAGGTPLKSHKDYYDGGTIPWLLSGEVNQGEIYSSTNFITQKGLDNSSARIFPSDTILVAMYGATAGQVGILKFPAATNQAVCGIYPNTKLLPKFIYYFFLNIKNDLIMLAAGNAQPNISQIKIRNQEIPVITLPEQRRIVKILDEVFANIAKAKEHAEKNLANATELFRSTLKASLERKSNWDNRDLESLLIQGRKISYGIVKPGRHDPNGVRLIKSQQVRDDKMDLTIDFRITHKLDQEYARTRLQGGELLLNLVGASIGRSAIAPIELRGSNVSRAIAVIPVLPEFAPWIQYNLRGAVGQKLIQSKTGGSAQGVLNLSEVRTLAIPIPPLKERQIIVSQLDALSSETKKLEALYRRKLAALEELKKSVLAQAFRGEL